MMLVVLTFLYPNQMYEAALWYIDNLVTIVAVLLLVDIIFWVYMYRRYRRSHPYQPVTLTRVERK